MLGVNALQVALTSSLNAQEKSEWELVKSLECSMLLNEEFLLEYFLFFLLVLITFLISLTY